MPSMPTPVPTVSVIVPTFREAPNLRPLTERLFVALSDAKIPAELIFVDDNSQDGSEQEVAELSREYPVRIVVRTRDRGLSKAVLCGFEEAQADRFVVLDADLQHPPEVVPTMVRHLDDPSCDFVIATRYQTPECIDRNWPLLRRLASRLATAIARPLARVSDPMSGFFALRRQTWKQAAKLDPIGYKIALELLVKAKCRNPKEVPIQFGTRTAGESKARLSVGLQYAWHLIKLYRFRFRWLRWIPSLVAVLAAMLAYKALLRAME